MLSCKYKSDIISVAEFTFIYAEPLYSLKITGTDEGGSAPNSVITFLIYSGGVRSYMMLKMLS